jgi:hypothetical protein
LPAEKDTRASGTGATVNKKWIEKRFCQRFSIEGATISYQNAKLLRFMMETDEEGCHVLDLNRGGIRFLHQELLKFNSGISLQLFTPGERIPLSIEGRVRWSVANPGMSFRYQTGVQFNAYGPGRNQNPVHLLDRLIALEQRAVALG